jgi:cystathionine beta-lyase/cystathionine gamma-synthase
VQKETLCVHSGSYQDDENRGVTTPVFMSSAFGYLDRESTIYPRYFNTPNQVAVEKKMCALEGADGAVLFSSGMAAISTTLLTLLSPGDHMVILDAVYGGTHAFIGDRFPGLGIGHTFVPTRVDAIEGAIEPETRVVFIESPTNPLLEVIDLRAVAELARRRGVLTVIDNTFATPINQNPIGLGIDVVVHSGTKYLGGHSDICCGIALGSTELADRIRKTARHLGGSLNAGTCYLIERSLKTLSLRIERQSQSAGRIATFLDRHPKVDRVHYPGLPSSTYHETARAQMKGFGGMLSFDLRDDQASDRLLRQLRLIKPAVSLGGLETIICSPAATSHATISAQDRRRVGIGEGLLRLSVGVEHVDDLIADLDRALGAT